MDKPYLVFGPLTEDVGHLLLDELFWFRSLVKAGKEVRVYSSRFSIENFARMFPDQTDRFLAFSANQSIRKFSERLHLILRIAGSKPIRNSKIIINGFEEISILLFLWKNRGRNNEFGLVLTNNVSPERLERSGKLLMFLFKRIFRRCDRVFHHTDYQLRLLDELLKDQDLAARFAKIKYHLLSAEGPADKVEKSRKIISYYGPVLESKPTKAIIDLILVDEDRAYEYSFYNIDEANAADIKSKVPHPDRITFVAGPLSHQDYIDSIRKSTYVLLPHNRLYEGKLSGILCDCIANSVPVISDRIEPVIELFGTYGAMGHIFDFNVSNQWPRDFLGNHSEGSYQHFITSMSQCRASHHEDLIIKEFLATF